MKKVFVALSGGVDSAVAAALLLREGYAVEGVFIKIWQPEFTECTWKEDRLAAMRVAVSLGIPLRTLDLSAEYERAVIDDMKREYAAGRTPNPDVLCNRHIKFGALWEYAKHAGADFIATGHHAQVRNERGCTQLVRGIDTGKDQAYFLWQLTKEDLAHILMPVGTYQKSEIRALAQRFRLPVAKRPDSQGLCFVGAVDMHSFLQELLHTEPGVVCDEGGREIGHHDGAALYTLGQRHGFTITDPAVGKEPHYVCAIDVAQNIIRVSPQSSAAARREVAVHSVSWVDGIPPNPGQYHAEVRYHQKPQLCTVTPAQGDTAHVVFESPQLAVPGQSLVLYNGEQCLGGGIIT